MSPQAEHLLFTVFKRKIGTTLTLAIALTIVLYFIYPAIAIVLGVMTALLIVWWMVFIING